MYLELDRRLRTYFKDSHTVIRRRGEKPRRLKSTEKPLGVLQDEPDNLTIVFNPAGGISFPNQGFAATHTIYDIPGLTAIDPMFTLSEKKIFLGREQETDTYQFDQFTSVGNVYPLRRFLKMLAGWKQSSDAYTLADQQLALFFEQRRQDMLSRLSSPKCFNLPPLATQPRDWRERLSGLNLNSHVPAGMDPDDDLHGHYTDKCNVAAARIMMEVAYEAVRNNPHVIGIRPDPYEKGREVSEVIVVPLDGGNPKDHGIQNLGIQYLTADHIYLSRKQTKDRLGRPFQELFLLLKFREQDEAGLIWHMSKNIGIVREMNSSKVSMNASERKELYVSDNPEFDPEQKIEASHRHECKISQVHAMLFSILARLPI